MEINDTNTNNNNNNNDNSIIVIIIIIIVIIIIITNSNIIYFIYTAKYIHVDAYYTMHIFMISSGFPPFSLSSQGSKVTAAASSIAGMKIQ